MQITGASLLIAAQAQRAQLRAAAAPQQPVQGPQSAPTTAPAEPQNFETLAFRKTQAPEAIQRETRMAAPQQPQPRERPGTRLDIRV